MKATPGSKTQGGARREEYMRLRLSGISREDAARAIGVLEPWTIQRYETWVRAIKRGERIVPAKRGAAS